ncbi:hypothetical protein GLOTRDRAFT_132870 [Gloeophyllum trabeum ATCC 11539]|uniref:RNI-like protein n=1 Tax=Gloeophyllum trabeum (strain ATCC 11539 / FP-39264 / Madison 617) TaxID=670483 RepID=S7PVI7_GLOTA|nr:uncharacterized protein GLOTRDRAFT_132870 [Gloeophyllum trabeum ATCC 11539]EPQ51503.1 hypothetical protein GLOTRDRAFT_132870 [Gloeophyllum trabeum ATCC 11539]
MVNSLSIEGCIPLCSFWELEESLKNIIIMCPRLTKLALSPDFLVAEEFRYLNLAPLLIARSTLTELSLGRSIPLSFCVLDFLGSMPQLQALSLYVGSTTQAELVYMDPACLAKLERLWLYLTDGCSLDCLAMLQTPSLIHLTVAGWGSGRMEDIMRVRGRNLKFLSLDTWSSMTDDRAAVSHCPVLEHLVVNQNTTVRSHPNLRFLDIWHCPEEDAPDWTPEPALFSNLERVRILDWSLKNIPNLLDVLPPTRDTDKDLRLLLPGAVVWDCPTRILEEEYVPSRGIVATYLPRNLGEFCRTDDRESSEQDDFDDSDDESYVYSSVPTSPWSCSSSASEIVEALKL